MLIQYVPTHVHPVTHHLNRHILRQVVRNAPPPNRVGTDRLRTGLPRTINTVGTGFAPETGCSRLVDLTAVRGPSQPSELACDERFPTEVVDSIQPIVLDIVFKQLSKPIRNRNRSLAALPVLQRRPLVGPMHEINVSLVEVHVIQINRGRSANTNPGLPQQCDNRMLP